MGNRQAAEKAVLTYIDKLNPGNPNVAIYKSKFAAMTDKDFDNWINELEKGNVTLGYIDPNETEGNSVSVERNLKIGEELKYEFFPKIIMTDQDTGLEYISNERYLVGIGPVRRQIQLLVNKISIPSDDQHLDQYTNQPTGPSKGSSISFPELNMLKAQGFSKVIDEFINFRAGDLKAYNVMKRLVLRDGMVTQETLASLRSTPKANETLQAFLLAMHLKNNIVKR